MSGIKAKLNGFVRGASMGLCGEDGEEGEADLPVVKTQPLSNGGMSGMRDLYLLEEQISFTVNGKPIVLDTTEVSATMSLARFLRSHLHLTGTKIMCAQAGCGACVVTAKFNNPATGQMITKGINSCITPVMKCDGWEITTTEGIGSREDGYDPVQQALATQSGTQCGYCSPGMVMAMHSLLANNPDPTMAQVEDILDGNLCRCTGYRPIFDAFKTFASDAPPALKKKLADIEDLATKEGKFKCPKTNEPCAGNCSNPKSQKPNTMKFSRTVDGEWMQPTTLNDLLALLESLETGNKYRLVAGNTGTGIYRDGPYETYIDITKVPDFANITTSPYNVGAGVPLTTFMASLEAQGATGPEFAYCLQMAKHIKKVANTNVRNIGSIAGNLMLKHAHNDFPSDIFNLLEGVGAQIAVIDSRSNITFHAPSAWINVGMTKKCVLFVNLPELTSEHKFVSYKITPRSQNAHAYVNAACLVKVNASFTVLEKPTLVFGGISGSFIRASGTEAILEGQLLNDQATLDAAVAVLDSEVVPEEDPILSSADYRKYLVQALFYKFVLKVCGDSLDPSLASGGDQVPRGVSKGVQSLTEGNPENFPLSERVPKLEAFTQVAGEAEYVDDIKAMPREVHGAFVLSTKANCDFTEVDTSFAMAMPGVLSYINHENIPGINSAFGGKKISLDPSTLDEEIFSSGHIYCSGQAIGMIVADTVEHARAAAKAVIITYANEQDPILTIEDALNAGNGNAAAASKEQLSPGKGKVTKIVDGSRNTRVTGSLEVGSQYHFQMETQSCLVWPIENGQFEVRCPSQFQSFVQIGVAKALDIPLNKVNTELKRIGGSYGSKIYRANLVATACAVAAAVLRRPVRVVLSLEDNMEMIEKRCPYICTYDVTLDSQNKLTDVSIRYISDAGYANAEGEAQFCTDFGQSCYKSSNWDLEGQNVVTNTPNNTSCRSPCSIQAVAVMEYALDHAAEVMGLDPLQLRLDNFIGEGESPEVIGPNPLPAMIDQLKTSAEYDTRVTIVDEFNAANAWKKRGITLTPMRWPIRFGPFRMTVQASIFAEDHTIALVHGGIEMGQGINTKVAQTVAMTCGVGLDKIEVKPTTTFVAPGNTITGGSLGSDLAAQAAKVACEDLMTRLQAAAAEEGMVDPTWEDLVQAGHRHGVDMTARHTIWPPNQSDGVASYDVWAACITEVEVDVLTGEKNIIRTDIIQDTGMSMSPEVDLGQIEGAFVMALGLWTSEEIKFDIQTGRLLTKDTWEYKPPASMDIPEDFRVTFYDQGNPSYGVLSSKATGEPSCVMGVSVLLALRKAIKAIRTSLGEDPMEWVELDGPATLEKIQRKTNITPLNFTLAPAKKNGRSTQRN